MIAEKDNREEGSRQGRKHMGNTCLWWELRQREETHVRGADGAAIRQLHNNRVHRNRDRVK